MKNQVEIRLATLNDINEVACLFDAYRQFYQRETDISFAREYISERLKQQQSVIFIADLPSNQSVGFCQIYPTFCSVEAAPIAILYDLYVIPTVRQSGAGRALMLAAQAYAKEAGYVRLDLSTAKTNVNAQALYESLGWVRDEQFYYYNLAFN